MSDFVEFLRQITNPAKQPTLTDAQVDALIVGSTSPLNEDAPCWPEERTS